MIIKRTWTHIKAKRFGRLARYHCTGWFLFGLLPLYIVREDVL